MYLHEAATKFMKHRAGVFLFTAIALGFASMRKVLTESGVNDDNIRTEEFTGY